MKFLLSKKIILLSGILILFGLLFPFPVLIDEIIEEPVTNLFHFPIGFIGVFLVSALLKQSSIPVSAPFVGALVLILACGIEFLQELTGRSASIEDIHITFWGILSGIAFSELNIYKTASRKTYISLLFFGFILGGLVSIPPIISGFRLYQEREALYPTLLSPDSGLSKLLIPVEFTFLHRNPEPGCAIRAHTRAEHWSGMELPVGNKDWSSFNKLSIQLKNESDKNLELLVRIDDSKETSEPDLRFGKKFLVEAHKEKKIVIDVSRIKDSVKGKKFDIHSIMRILIVNNQSEQDFTFCVSRIELM